MLIRHTLLYLPAQLIPAAFQFTAFIAWAHFVSSEIIGMVAVFTATQELINIVLTSFWNLYTIRFGGKFSETEEGRSAFASTTTSVLAVSLVLQSIIASLIFWLAIDPSVTWWAVLVIVVLVSSRSLLIFQSERARTRSDIALYSVAVMSGPVVGFLLGLLLLSTFGSHYIWIFAGFAGAQLLGALFGLLRDRGWIKLGLPDPGLLRDALRYGMPLIVSSVVGWVTLNAARLVISFVLGLSAAGIYSLGFGLGYRASTVAAMGLTVAAFPIAVRLYNEGDAEGAIAQLAQNGALLFAVLCSSVLGLALVASDILRLFVPSNLRSPVEPIMVWTLVAGGIICLRSHFFNQIFLLKGRTRAIAKIAIWEAATVALLAAIAVPLYGPTAGAVTLAVTAALYLTITIRLALREGLMVPWRAFAKSAVASTLMALAVLATPAAHSISMLGVRIAAGGGVFLLVIAALNALALRDFLRTR